jgi:CRISPR-associated exonuclease Cas4
VTLLVALLAVVTGCYVLLWWWRRRESNRLGLARGALMAADDAKLGMPTLRSERLGLVGRPDHLLRVGPFLVPVERKPRARTMQASHMLQVAAQCLLVQEVYGVRPPYGLLVLAKGLERRVPFTVALERKLLDTMAEMRDLLAREAQPGPRWVEAKCLACGFREICWDSIQTHPVRPTRT